MLWTISMAIAALLVSVVLLALGGFFCEHKRLYQGVGVLPWVGLVGSFGLVSAGLLHGGGALLLCASFAVSCAVSALPCSPVGSGAIRRVSVIGLISALCAVVLAANSYFEPIVEDPNLVLFAGQWAAIAASLALAMGATAKDRGAARLQDVGLLATALLGTLFMGAMRHPLPGFSYAVELSSAGQHVRWALPAVTPGAPLFGFEVVQVVPFMDWLISMSLLCVLIAGGLTLLGKSARHAAPALIASALFSLLALGAVLRTGFGATLPDAAPYAAYARDLGVEQGVPEQILAMGRFEVGETIYVLWLDVLGDVALLGGSALLALLVASSLLSRATQDALPEPAGANTRHRALREFGLYAAGLCWVGFVLALLINWRIHSVYGVGSVTEWVMMGACLLGSGGALLAWSPQRFVQRLGVFGCALAPALIIVLSLVFDALPGVVMW